MMWSGDINPSIICTEAELGNFYSPSLNVLWLRMSFCFSQALDLCTAVYSFWSNPWKLPDVLLQPRRWWAWSAAVWMPSQPLPPLPPPPPSVWRPRGAERNSTSLKSPAPWKCPPTRWVEPRQRDEGLRLISPSDLLILWIHCRVMSPGKWDVGVIFISLICVDNLSKSGYVGLSYGKNENECFYLLTSQWRSWYRCSGKVLGSNPSHEILKLPFCIERIF